MRLDRVPVAVLAHYASFAPPPRGVERGTPEVPNGRSGKFRKISRPLDATVHLVSLIQDGKSVPWIHSKCGRHVAWSWRWGVTSGASQNTPPRTPNFGRISEEFRKRFPTYYVAFAFALRCVALRENENVNDNKSQNENATESENEDEMKKKRK